MLARKGGIFRFIIILITLSSQQFLRDKKQDRAVLPAVFWTRNVYSAEYHLCFAHGHLFRMVNPRFNNCRYSRKYVPLLFKKLHIFTAAIK
jgi:hypothetical protein